MYELCNDFHNKAHNNERSQEYFSVLQSSLPADDPISALNTESQRLPKALRQLQPTEWHNLRTDGFLS